MPGDPSRPQAEGDRHHRRALGPVHPAWRTGPYCSDNDRSVVAKAVQAWIAAVGSKTAYITPGSPWENGYVESFNARLRDELLNGEISTPQGGAGRDRKLEAPATTIAHMHPGIPAARSGGVHPSLLRLASCARPTSSAGQATRGGAAYRALTLHLGPPRGGDQDTNLYRTPLRPCWSGSRFFVDGRDFVAGMVRQVIAKADDVLAFDQTDIRDLGELREPLDRRAHVRDEMSIDFFLKPLSISTSIRQCIAERLASATSHSENGCDYFWGYIDWCCLLAHKGP